MTAQYEDLFQEIYEDYYSKILSYIGARVNDSCVAEDLTSDVFFKCYKNIERYDPSKAAISTWIFTITNNKYQSGAYLLCCDDLERENGNQKKADSMRESCEKNGWTAVSMKDDWKTIYGDNVTRKAA